MPHGSWANRWLPADGGWILGLAEDMPFEAKVLAPSGADPEALHGAFEDAAAGGVAVLEAPSGHVLAEGLASALTSGFRL